MKEIIVIGAGASGLMAAISAAGHGASVRVLEHMDRPAKKLLSTGNGRCNLTNEFMDEKCYPNDRADIVMRVLDKFNQNDVVGFFASIGVLTKVRHRVEPDGQMEGYVYPVSDQASTVLDGLVREAKHLGVEFIYGVRVNAIERVKSKEGRFTVRCGFDGGLDVTYTADSLILATGSKAAPVTGSDGSGYKLAKALGHRVVKPLPALVPLVSKERFCKELAGVRCDASLSFFSCEKNQCCGEVQFTDFGISGIPVFQLSRDVVRLLDEGKKTYAILDLIPNFTREALFNHIRDLCETHGDAQAVDALSGLLNSRLASVVCKKLGIDKKCKLSELNGFDLKIVVDGIKSFEMDISGYKSFDRAQVCSGGVLLDEIDPDTMESRLCPGLYLVGELLDVDGICGGYNLQWAWSSGHLAGISAAKNACKRSKV